MVSVSPDVDREGSLAAGTVLLLVAGTLNIIYGIAAVGNAYFFDNNYTC